MKSLEIVNANIEEYLLKIAQLEEDLKICSDEQEENILAYLEVEKELLEDWEKIKADLEVLEILRKKDVNIKLLKSYIKEELENDEDILECYNSHLETYRQLTLEELLKLKKWLEVNENELGK